MCSARPFGARGGLGSCCLVSKFLVGGKCLALLRNRLSIGRGCSLGASVCFRSLEGWGLAGLWR